MKNSKCINCDYCKQIHRKAGYSYGKDNWYYCILLEKLTEKSEICDYYKKRQKVYDFSKERFDQVEDDLETIKRLL